MSNPRKKYKELQQILAEHDLSLDQDLVQRASKLKAHQIFDAVDLSHVADIANTPEKMKQKRAILMGNDKVAKEQEFSELLQNLQKVRKGLDEKTDKGATKPRAVSFAEIVRAEYGLNVMQYLRYMYGVTPNDTIATLAQKTGNAQISLGDVESIMLNHGKTAEGSFGGTIQSTGDINNAYRFIIPEFIFSAINLGYINTAKHLGWIAGTETVDNTKSILVPYIKRGNVMPHEIKEGGDIPVGTLDFGQKSVKIKKYGICVKLTYELITQSSLNMLAIFLSLAGSEMTRGADVEAISVIINGEQSDGSEEPAMIGVQNVPVSGYGLTQYDVEYMEGLLRDLNHEPNLIITRLKDSIRDLNAETPDRDRLSLRQFASQMGMDVNTFSVPEGTLYMLDTRKALMMINYGDMMVETKRMPENQTESIFISKQMGFFILRRDAIGAIDATQDIVALPVPAFFDAELQNSIGFNS